MRLGKELTNTIILTLDEGRLLGRIQDLYLDDNLETVLGVYLGSQGLIRRKSELIRSEDVSLYGLDAILVKNATVVTDDSQFATAKNWMRREKLIGRQVDTPGGTRLGVIGDVVVDSNGSITGFALSKTFVEGPLADKRFIYRAAIVDTGSVDGGMTVDLPKLEAMLTSSIDGPVVIPEMAEATEVVIDLEPPAGVAQAGAVETPGE